MCGFAAYVGTGAHAQFRTVRDLAERVAHRGPDQAGAHVSARSALAHQRLSIVDLATGGQPLVAEDGTSLVCNGEIYNHARIRRDLEGRRRFATRSDSEAILQLYLERGPDCVRDLDGMFSFVVAGDQGSLAARDPFGIKPLYFVRDGEGTWFGSELKAMPPGRGEVTELPPGSLLTDTGEIRRWFDPGWVDPAVAPQPEDPAKLTELLERAVVKRLMADVPLGVFLSGGLDSSVIAAVVRRHIPALHSFSVGLEGAPDLAAARHVSRHLGTIHHERVYTAKEATDELRNVIFHLESYDPALIRSAVPCWFVSALAADHVKVVLSGEGSDEVFAGYAYMEALQDPRALHRECVRLLQGLHNMNLQRVDRMTMAHALEGRVPFLDTELVAWAMSLDPAGKVQHPGRPEKLLLRRSFADALPGEIAFRKKVEFAAGCASENIFERVAEESVTDGDFRLAAERFPEDPPATKEAFLYRRMFDELFPGDASRRTVGRWRGTATASP